MPKPLEPDTAFWPIDDPPVEAYVDGELEPEAHSRFERELAHSRELAAEVELARAIRRGLSELPRPSCPPEVTARVLERVEARRGPWHRWASWWAQRLGLDTPSHLPSWAWAPALVLVVAVALAIGLTTPEPPAPGPSAEEIARAEADVKLALAYVDRIATTTSTAVGREGLGEHVARPFARSIAAALEPHPTEQIPR
jgi:anti-sigma factor RsiW